MKCMKISVLLLVITLTKSLAMSIDELQDFSNFLKETSLLDQPLKKNPSTDDDDDVPISDHAWEESGRFEGDLILNDRQRQLIVQDIAEGLSRNGLKDSTKRWPNNEVIFYIQKEHFTGEQVQAILSGIEELSQASCVKFRPYRKGDRDAVVVQGSRRGCFSQVGYQGGYQVLNLSGRHPVGRGCFRHGTVVHEFLHTLGFYHMQSSPDRDDYIDVVWENIVQPARHNFRKYNLFSVSDYGVGYDYDSVLHYSRKAFSSNGGDTLVPKQSGAQIGQRVGLSNKDSAKLNKMYCDADSNNFEAADDVPHGLVIKKKKTPKNKPFEGHGIGYHQGKTVVFKLPAAETFRLPDTPPNHVFDYFSKTPQAMSPTLIEGFGVRKEINYSYKLPATYAIVEQNIRKHIYPPLINRTMNAINAIMNKDSIENKNDHIKPSNAKEGNNSKETLEDLDEKAIEVDKTKNTHTIDSNTYTDVYKPNIDYSKFYNPVKDYKDRTQTDYYLNYSPESKHKQDHSSEEIPNLTLTKQFIEKLRKPKQSHLFSESDNREREPVYHNEFNTKRESVDKPKAVTKDDITQGDGGLFNGKVYPYTKLEEIKSIYFLKPEYMSKKYLENKDDFSSLYNPSEIHSTSRNAKYKIFGEPVPLTENYMPKKTGHIRAGAVDSLGSNKEIVEESEEGTTHSSNNPNTEYNGDDDVGRKYRYEEFSSQESSLEEKSTDPTQFTSNEGSSKSYEVTEKNVEHIAVVTKKPTASLPEEQDEDHILEKRLPQILASYVHYDDNYDITSPCIVSHFNSRC